MPVAFRWGPVPGAILDPPAGGTRLRPPGRRRTAGLTVLATTLALAAWLGLHGRPGPIDAVHAGAAVVATWILHELLHLLAYPRGTPVELGLHAAQLHAYAHAEATLSRERWLLVYLLPFLVLTGGASLVGLALLQAPAWLAVMAVLNAWISGEDLAAATRILRGLDRREMAAQRGPHLYRVAAVPPPRERLG